jgi:hypothetical protein
VIDIVPPWFGRYGIETINWNWNTYCASKSKWTWLCL